MTRRTAIKQGLAGILAYAVAPTVLPARLFGQTAPSNRLNVALIGNGLMCHGHVGVLLGRDECRIVATCDVWRAKAEKTRDRIEKQYGADQASGAWRGVDVYQRYEDALAREDVDLVWVCTPDHWHAPIANAAMKAGKDVYCEKPLTLTVREGRALVDTARHYGRVLQTGSQQRSNRSFRKAAEMVRNGWIGDIKRIRTRLGTFPAARPLPEEPVPADLDYDRWLGPTPWRPFNPKRIVGDFSGGWRCYAEYGGRKNGDWGAHHFDIVQWALGMDDSGPVEFIPKGYEGARFQTHIYANGVAVERDHPDAKQMIEFIGAKGTIGVSRADLLVSDPPDLATRALRAEDLHLYASADHHGDFLNAVRLRQRPIADVEIGHRTATICHLNNIAEWAGRPIRWDPLKEQIIGDEPASRQLERPRRAPYSLL